MPKTGSEANYTLIEQEILATYKGIRAASEVTDTKAQLLLVPPLPVLGWMFKAKVASTHHVTDATWSKWTTVIVLRARVGPGIVEAVTNWPEGEEVVTHTDKAPPYKDLSDHEKQYALFTDGSCHLRGNQEKWNAAV